MFISQVTAGLSPQAKHYGYLFVPLDLCQQHGRVKLLAVSKLDEAISIMAAGRLHMTHTIKCILRVAGDSKNTSSIRSHLHFYVQLKFAGVFTETQAI